MIDTLTTATLELEQYLKDAAQAIAPTCSGCSEFISSERTPCVGICMLWAEQVLSQDKACSNYYQDAEPAPVGSDNEF
jgi:hypothetical protein